MTKGRKEILVGKVIKGIEVLAERRVSQTKYRLDLKCVCGKLFDARKDIFKKKEKISCGCLGRKEYKGKHGKYKTKLYKNYHAMLGRCNNEKSDSFKDYGNRGIRVCDEWSGKDGYLIFEKWALQNGYSEKVSLDRIDVNGNYEPSNCRYADNKTQGRNKRYNWTEFFDGQERLVIEICEEYNINYNTLGARKSRGKKGDDLFAGLI